MQFPSTYPARRKARRFALQGLYEWQMTGNPAHEIEARTRADNAMHKVDVPYYHELLSQVTQRQVELDTLLQPYSDRQLSDLGLVEWSILRVIAYELAHRAEIPWRVLIDEGIELAKHFGATDSHRYINGVLNQLARQLRATEVSMDFPAHTGRDPKAD